MTVSGGNQEEPQTEGGRSHPAVRSERKIAVIRFPGSNCDLDVVHALRDVVKINCELVWHADFKGSEYAGVVLPGGFSYGDHLRAGIIAAFSPAVKEVKQMASEGKPVIGICNGFQILTESGLLPGALLKNEKLNFVCKWVSLRIDSEKSFFTKGLSGKRLELPVAHGEGRYYIEEDRLREMERNGQIVFRYAARGPEDNENPNPNGSLSNIAGVCNEQGNVVGLMPHPERACEKLLGGEDGLMLLQKFIEIADRRK
ncbi:Phosphoribosylformylglycinamidine synthase subunit PurQ [Candidatus Gugararchaeum adminiculabundum]|nr:Phosphoribosylformylglycinamidine synthase subunit PurQ [Candidatus Gugararchaeum adminiculabundum]